MKPHLLAAVLFCILNCSCSVNSSVSNDDDFVIAKYSSFGELYMLRWLCVPTSWVYLGCDDYGVDEETGEHHAYTNFRVQVSPHIVHHFDYRRGTDMEGCQANVKEWVRVMEEQQEVCILGGMGGPSIQRHSHQLVLDYAWTLYQVKTKKACNEWGTDFDCNIKVPEDLKNAPGTVSQR